ncbi:2-hydroxyacid dehydrogenase [Oricola sp.]|uniref:2-hydroxyacid dehydrogenase n=1 Tax=Oricola sp. TaxID=1979950 RepID=UPI003BA8FDB6
MSQGTTNLDDITIIMPSRFNPRADQRIREAFAATIVDAPDPAAISPDVLKATRGLAAWLSPAWIPLIDALPNLEIIANFGVGYDTASTLHAIGKDVVVTHTPSVLDEEVADTAMALLLNATRELYQAEKWLREGRWHNEGNYRLTPLTLRERTVGIYGLGRIGKAIARRIEAFGLPIHYHNRKRDESVAYPWHASLEDLARAVDTLIVVVPGTPETARTIDATILQMLGPDGVLVNIGRGTTVDEPALIAALSDGTIAAAGLDVFEDEPYVPAELMAMDNVCLLPHVGSASVRTRALMGDLVADNLVSWFTRGETITAVPEAGHLAKRKID